ncbi:MAG: hypothetical protein ACXWUN_04900 [Allosphingosinicella sp.]
MKALTKYLAGAAVATALTVTAASPASAQYYDRRHRDNGIDTGDVIAGVAVLGGIAAIVAAMSNDGNRYGYDNRNQYRDNYTNAVNSCGYEAGRYGQGGQVSITDIDRRSNSSYRVRGVIDAGYANNNRYGGYGTADRYGGYANDNRYGGYGAADRYGRYDPYGRYGNNSGYGSNDRYGNYYGQRTAFACTARADGRITDFDIDRRY